MKIADYCKHTDCPAHPNNKESNPSERIVLQSDIGDIKIEVSFPCLICDKAEKIDMKDMLKRAILKKKLKNNNDTFISK